MILDIISTTFIGPNYETQVQQARQIQIEKLVRRGRYSQNKTRPLSVTFAHQRDLQELLANRKYLCLESLLVRNSGNILKTNEGS